MPRDARFWRNVTIIAVAHIAILIWLVSWNRTRRTTTTQNIVWMTGGTTSEPIAEVESSHVEPESEATTAALNKPIAPSAKSEIELPSPSLTPAPTPAVPKPSSTPAHIPAPSPRPTTKKSVVKKTSPNPSPKKQAAPIQNAKPNESNKDARREGAGAENSGATRAANAEKLSALNSYKKMLYGRFYSEWVQPTTSVAIGAKISALVKIRIEKDGRVSNFEIVKPSGNVVVDESVAAVGKRVIQVDSLPEDLVRGTHYDVTIGFELNPKP